MTTEHIKNRGKAASLGLVWSGRDDGIDIQSSRTKHLHHLMSFLHLYGFKKLHSARQHQTYLRLNLVCHVSVSDWSNSTKINTLISILPIRPQQIYNLLVIISIFVIALLRFLCNSIVPPVSIYLWRYRCEMRSQLSHLFSHPPVSQSPSPWSVSDSRTASLPISHLKKVALIVTFPVPDRR